MVPQEGLGCMPFQLDCTLASAPGAKTMLPVPGRTRCSTPSLFVQLLPFDSHTLSSAVYASSQGDRHSCPANPQD